MATDPDGADRQELTQSLRLVAIAVASAAMTATIVIGVGGAWLDRSEHRVSTSIGASVRVIQTAG